MGVGPLSRGRRAVFFDRDGVLNRAVVRDGRPYPPSSVDELEIEATAARGVDRVRALGCLAIAVTNQPDVARGTQTRAEADALNRQVAAAVGLDALAACYHDNADDCACRKPRPGLLVDAAARWHIDLGRSFIVGDRWRDVDAGRRAGCRTVFIDYSYREARPDPPADLTVHSLEEAVTWIVDQISRDTRAEATPSADALRIKLFADGADRAGMLEMYGNPRIKGFTTNPTLMRKAGIADYEAFSRDIVLAIPDRPLSLEVFSDEFDEMERQAASIASWGEHVYVKIPITNTRAESSLPLIERLSKSGVKLNVTALMTLAQVRDVCLAVKGGAATVVSVFAGRVADTGRDPVPMMAAARELTGLAPNTELLWASPRELLNIFQADAVGCDIITATNDILKKLELVGKDLDQFSLETVQMFRDDAVRAGFSL
ncbi:Transaldolase [Luteitalea pratensis]|uniref:D,D-heptose 1,7-bisphosphate phosphatase n=1 Tax=Luteitalea pratensis TaxID=1855912 RepID=A0A143PUF3_LUTPR|nr:transaldolase [Luteitalea pratensis]AMY11720.1 Transaldolase [Luteitalea pratensis]